MKASVHLTGPDGVTVGYLAALQVVPQVGEELCLLGADGSEARALVDRVVHVLAHTQRGSVGGQQVEVYATEVTR